MQACEFGALETSQRLGLRSELGLWLPLILYLRSPAAAAARAAQRELRLTDGPYVACVPASSGHSVGQ